MSIYFERKIYQFMICLCTLALNICLGDYKYQLSICAIFQNEAPYLKEWIEFHRLMGVEHFYLYNHRSQDHYQQVLQPYLLAGIIELTHKQVAADDRKTFNALQCQCYSECLKKARGVSQWVAFLDIDEFLFPVKKQTLPEVLKNYEQFGGVDANWLIFGTSHIWKIPSHQLVIESLTRCANKAFKGNRYVKSIVRPERTSHFTNPHHPVYEEGFFGVNTDKLPIETMWSDYLQVNTLRINHYWTRDGEYFYRQKMPRHQKWRGDPDPQAIQSFIQTINAEEDQNILRFLPALKKSMNQETSDASGTSR